MAHPLKILLIHAQIRILLRLRSIIKKCAYQLKKIIFSLKHEAIIVLLLKYFLTNEK